MTRTKSAETFYIAKTLRNRDTGKSTSKIVRRLGTRSELERVLPSGTDVAVWAKEQARRMSGEERALTRKISVSFDPTRRIAADERRVFNCGYLFLQDVYSRLGLPALCQEISQARKFDFDLDAILSRLVFGRVPEPASKRATVEFARGLIEQPGFETHQVYRALSVLAQNSERIQAQVFEASKAVVPRRTKTLYYDCANYCFEITQEDTFRRYGPSREHRPSPIVGMGLMMDADGLPLAFTTCPGNESEQPTLPQLEDRLESDFGLTKLIVSTDAGLSSVANRVRNSRGDLQLVVTVSLRKQPKEIKEWARDSSGWLCVGQGGKFDLAEVCRAADDPATPQPVRARLYGQTFYKTRWASLADPDTKEELGQNLIVTFSLRYRNYQRSVRQAQVERAACACENGSAKRMRKGPKDPMRFVSSTSITEEGEVADKTVFRVDEKKVAEEASWDGFYGLATSLDDMRTQPASSEWQQGAGRSRSASGY
ncbi:transposase [Olsenella sp. Marseille-P4559]|uniref:IS1634 family transposase n=1 Tax=Olsenella sp. Marseille-P4559 TaxID=2364795 RepID=UPI00103184D5|nr:transposase [Olsenella sp. Marseille-P4559]